MFQSTHPHGVRLCPDSLTMTTRVVSIHAPTRGATILMTMRLLRTRCFNPRTHTGCDAFVLNFLQNHLCFNPRTHTGCDLHRRTMQHLVLLVSIHAPTRGATCCNIICSSTACFNPRTHTGCDIIRWWSGERFKFQSTHPHGVRPNLARL